MIGHGRKDPRPELNAQFRQECLANSSRLSSHNHMKKDLQMFTKYPHTLQKLEEQGLLSLT